MNGDPNKPNSESIEWRVKWLEEFRADTKSDIAGLRADTNQQFLAIRSTLQEMRVIMARYEGVQANACPAPGRCLTIQEDLDDLEMSFKGYVEKNDTRQRRLEWMVGGFTGGCAVIAFFAPLIWKFLG